jgi:protein-disulfide isomerase
MKRIRIAGLALIAFGLVGFSPLMAQESDETDIRAEIEALKQGQQQMRRQLNEIKTLIQQQAKPAAPSRQGPKVEDVVFDLGTNEVKGAKDAGLTLIEFTDYQ